MIQAQKLECPRQAPEALAKPTTNTSNFPIEDESSKDLASLKARMALAGHSVYDGGNDDYIVVKADWCMSRHCCNLAALIAFGRQLRVL